MNYSSLQIETLPLGEAARLAVTTGLNKGFKHDVLQMESSRTFWVLYCLEKELSFNTTKCSVRETQHQHQTTTNEVIAY